MVIKALILGLLVVCCLADESPLKKIVEEIRIITKDFTDELKKRVTWVVQDFEDNVFKGWTNEEFRQSLGDRVASSADGYSVEPESNYKQDAPATLDWSTNNCTHAIRDQGKCASCWAFSAASIVSDRCCLKGSDHGWLSPQELVSCDKTSQGCQGGQRIEALQYIEKKGLVHESCAPYTGKDGHCPGYCVDGKDWGDSHVCKCTNARNCMGEKGIISCLSTGPVGVGMKIYEDILYYKSGVYKWDGKSKFQGLHAIKLVGYGPGYWKCANTWGASWGMDGYFMIGRDECELTKTGAVTCDVVP